MKFYIKFNINFPNRFKIFYIYIIIYIKINLMNWIILVIKGKKNINDFHSIWELNESNF